MENTRHRFAGGDPGWIRTSDPQLRRLMLYPAELRGQRTLGLAVSGSRRKAAAIFRNWVSV